MKHSCPVCRCAWVPEGVVKGTGFKSRAEEVAWNVQRMAAEIRRLRTERTKP